MVTKERKKEGSKRKSINKDEIQSQETAVDFRFRIPEAKEVCLAGEFNGWDPQSCPMEREGEGTWRTSKKLSPGRYEFKLFADQSWVEDLPWGEAVVNPFGTWNFVLWVK